ncbi:MAG: phosphoglucosamine mutase [Bryobacterales bacterium]|nr:phosphoglucosamine mutase [Bryobacterales bacterium]
MARQLFGTDGIRGVAGEYPLDAATVFAVGSALGHWVREHGESPEVVIGMDTRESGPRIAAQLAAGLVEQGARPTLAGNITTPGIAYLTRKDSFVAGVMISASHNPYRDNGIKVFGHSGFKLPDEVELELERTILARRDGSNGVPEHPLIVEPSLDNRYLEYLAQIAPNSLAGLKLVVDCGNGASHELAPILLRRLGAMVETIGCEPDGRNINLGCGALHVDKLQEQVKAVGADAGFAFDGDADRCIGVASDGSIVDGDAVLLIAARHLLRKGQLGEPVVVSTVMSNLGFEKALQAEGIKLLRAPVGDKYVLEEMIRSGAKIGGEQSGHVIFLDHATTGDGILTALQVLRVMVETGEPLTELKAGFVSYPQVLINVRVKHKKPLKEMPAVEAVIAQAETELAGDGRVLVRFSGTEPLARVMVEGPTQEKVEELASRIAAAIRAELA